MGKAEFNREVAQFELKQYASMTSLYVNEIERWAHYQRATDKTKEFVLHEIAGFLNRIMVAKNGDELTVQKEGLVKVLKKLDEAHIMMKSECDAILSQLKALIETRQSYLPQPFYSKSHWKGRGWVIFGTALVVGALIATVVGAPFIPAVALGGVVLAYGATDISKELAKHLRPKKQKNLSVGEGPSFETFQGLVHKGSQSEIDSFINQYTVPRPTSAVHLKEKKGMQKVKWGLAIASIALAVSALMVVFPPLGVPLGVAATIGALSCTTIGVSCVAMVKRYFNTKKEVATIKGAGLSKLKVAEACIDNILNVTLKEEPLKGEDTRDIMEKELKSEDMSLDSKKVAKMEGQIEEEKSESLAPIETLPEPSPSKPKLADALTDALEESNPQDEEEELP
jgi:hypothetical protein